MGNFMILAAEGGVVDLSSILSDIGTVFGKALEWAGTVGTTIVSTPILFIGVILGFIGIGIGFFSRLLHMR